MISITQILRAFSCRIGLVAVLATALLFGGSKDAQALTCEPPVNFTLTSATVTGGFTLGCASPALWTVLSVGGGTLSFTGDNLGHGGTGAPDPNGSRGQVGSVGGTLKATNNGVQFYDDVFVTNGIFPSTKATNTKDFNLATIQNPYTNDPKDPKYNSLQVGNELLVAAKSDALKASASAAKLATTGGLFASWNNKTIKDTTEIKAVQKGLNVINLKAIELGKGEKLTFSTGGYTDVQFVVNITGGDFKLTSADILLQPSDTLVFSDIMFNVLNGKKVTFDSSRVAGVIFDLGGDISIKGTTSTIVGALVGGKNMALSGGAEVHGTPTAISGCTADDKGIKTCVIHVPEPGSLGLLALGLIMMLGIGRRSWKSRIRFQPTAA